MEDKLNATLYAPGQNANIFQLNEKTRNSRFQSTTNQSIESPNKTLTSAQQQPTFYADRLKTLREKIQNIQER